MTKNKATNSKQQQIKRPKLDDDDESTITLTDEEKRVIMIQYQKEHESDATDTLLAEYLKFMRIKINEKNTGECAAPSKMLDEMWHAHILSTKEHQQFCERHNNGDFIHHDPSMTDVPARYRITWMRYLEIFKSEPKDRNIWPTPEVEDEEAEWSDDDYGCG